MTDRSQDYIGGCADEDGVMCWWRVGRLWELAKELPVRSVPVSTFDHLLSQRNLILGIETNRHLMEEVRRVLEAELEYPIILSPAGWIMDGHHRLLKAIALGLSEVRVVQFVEDPPPDERKTKEQWAEEGACVV